MAFQARLTTQQQLAYCPQTSASGDGWQKVYTSTTTSGDAAAPYTSVVDTLHQVADHTYNGRYWVTFRAGANKGQSKRVVATDNGASTMTVEATGFDNAIASADEYELWLSPDPMIVVDSSSGATNIVDAIRTEADDFWKNYYVCPLTGTERGKIGRITAFSNATATFTVEASAFSAALAVGTPCAIRRFVDITGVSPGVSEEWIPGLSNRINFSRADGVRGPRAGSFGFNTHIRAGLHTASTGISAVPDVGGMMQAVGLEDLKTGDLAAEQIQAGATTTSLPIGTGTWENYTIGQGLVVNNEMTFVTALTDGAAGYDTLGVRPPLSVAPVANDRAYAQRTYIKTVDGDQYPVVLEYEADGVRTIMTGCKGSVDHVDGSALEFAWSFNVDHYIREIEAAPYTATAAYSTAPPALSQDRTAYLDDGSTATKVDVNAVASSPGTVVARRMVQGSSGINGGCGYQITNYECRLSWNELLDNSLGLPQESRWLVRTERDAMVVYGDGNYFFAVRVPAAKQIESPHPADADGLQQMPVVFEAQDAGTYNDPDGTVLKVPDFCFVIS